MRGFTLFLFVVLFACVVESCKDEPTAAMLRQVIDTPVAVQKNRDTVRKKTKSLLDVLPARYVGKAAYYYAKYMKDTVGLGAFLYWELYEDFEGIKLLGHLRNGGRPDSIFVLPPLCAADTGDSYYFSDTSVPRLSTISYCCHPENIFVIGDIDEDGISEIGEYLSSCSSRYKALLVWSLKNNEWKKVGECMFDINYPDPTMNKRVRKIGKGEFKMLEVSDVEKARPDAHGNWMKEKRCWKQFRF